MSGRQLRITKAEIIRKGSLLGLIDVEFAGLRLLKLPVIAGPHGVFIGLARSAKIGRDGKQERDAAGKLAFDPLVEWQSKDIANRFQAAIRQLIEADYPALLAGEAVQPTLALADRGFGQPARRAEGRRSPEPDPGPEPLADDPVDDLWR